MMDRWQEVTLQDVSEDVTVGHVGPMADQYLDAGVPFLRSLNVEPFRINTTDLKRISRDFHNRLKKSALKPGDIVIVRTGKPGSCAVIPDWLVEANCSDVVVVRPSPRVRAAYIAYVVNSSAVQHIDAHTVGAVQQHFNVGSARQIKFRLPSISEQDRILGVLSALDDKIDLNRRMNETLEAMARAIFKDWFVDFGPTRAKMEGRASYLAPEMWALFPDRLDEDGKPLRWNIATVEDVAERISMGPFGSNIKVETFVEEGMPIISGRHLHATLLEDNVFDFITTDHAERLSNSNVKRGDIIFTHAGNIGQVSLIPETSRYERYVISQRQFFLRCDTFKVSPIFMIYFFKSNEGQHKLLANASQVGVPSIARPATNLKAIGFCLPAKPLIDSFDQIIQALHLKIGRNRQESETLSAIRNLLLPKLMSGEIRVKEAEKIAEEVL